jgi:hippurate hydrolase
MSLPKQLGEMIEHDRDRLLELYKYLHAHPELSGQEEKTAFIVAQEFSRQGIEVTTRVGGHGVVGVVENGQGPVVMIRGDMDALPIEEATGLPYRSTVRVKNEQGEEVPVMHACGHDLHTTILVGTASILMRLKDEWKGTLLLVAQPAEEALGGAQRMLSDGLFSKFPRPDFALSLHVKPEMPIGKVALSPGYITLGAEVLDIIIHGQGGHGARPHKTKDPVVLAAQTIMAIQTIISREIDPAEKAVITVGAIHGGSLHNIIPDKVTLKLTLRSSSTEVANHLINAIRRITRGIAQAAGLSDDRMPEILALEHFYPPVYNDPALTDRILRVFNDKLGTDNVIMSMPQTGSEDFSEFGMVEPRIPLVYYFIGANDPGHLERVSRGEEEIHSLHTPKFAPEPEITLKTGLLTMSSAVLELLGRSSSPMKTP